MKTSDKELDDLFSSKLNGLEAEPSANLWQNISLELDKKPKKKSFVQGLRIAAAVIVLLSIGLFWMQANKQLVKKQLPQKVVKLKVKPEQTETVQLNNNFRQKHILLLSTKNKAVKEASHLQTSKLANSKPKTKSELSLDEPANKTIVQNKPQEQQLATLPQPIAVVPDASVPLKVQTETEEEAVKKELVLTAKTKPETAVSKRKGIRNVGDLVNLVMDKVDKRQNKLIEFSNNEDDESNVTGINLGIISIKKEK